MLNKIKTIITNEQGMETIEVIGIGVMALIGVALFYGAINTQVKTTVNKTGNGLTGINSLGIGSSNSALNTAVDS